MSQSLTDSFGRVIDYLRISVIDTCNFRCTYCTPPEGAAALPRQDWLDFADIARIATAFVALGGTRIRLTGGEPLLRKDLPDLIRRLAPLRGLEWLSLTTNGYFLSELARPLRAAGLEQLNISLDALNPSLFAQRTQRNAFHRVWAGIEAAIAEGFTIKLNVVALKGLTKEDIIGFGRLAMERSIDVRFIEFMPLCGSGWNSDLLLPIGDVRAILQAAFPLVPLERGCRVAEPYRIADSGGRIGFIGSMTEPFCDTCSRLRLTADGKLRSCLFSQELIDLRPALQSPGLDAIQAVIREAVRRKPAGHGIQAPATARGEDYPVMLGMGG